MAKPTQFLDYRDVPSCAPNLNRFEKDTMRVYALLDYAGRQLLTTDSGEYTSILWGQVLVVNLTETYHVRDWSIYEGFIDPSTTDFDNNEQLRTLIDRVSSWGSKLGEIAALALAKRKCIVINARFGYGE